MFGNMLQYILDYGKDNMPYFSSHRERAVYDQIRQEINLESASGFYGLDEAKEVWDYALARYEEQQSICACFRARIERSNRINELINGRLDENLLNNSGIGKEIKERIQKGNSWKGIYYQDDFICANHSQDLDNYKYSVVQVFIRDGTKRRACYQVFDSETGKTVVPLSDKIIYLNNDCFFRTVNGTTSLIKNNIVYAKDLIVNITKINDKGCALFYDKNCFLGLINLNFCEYGRPKVKIFGHIHSYNMQRINSINNNNESYITITNFDGDDINVVLNGEGNIIYFGNDTIATEDDGYYIFNEETQKTNKIAENKVMNTKSTVSNNSMIGTVDKYKDLKQILLSIKEAIKMYNELNPSEQVTLTKKRTSNKNSKTK